VRLLLPSLAIAAELLVSIALTVLAAVCCGEVHR
jgi:hypothetical protein